MTVAQVRAALLRDPGLADLHLVDRGGWIGSDLVSVVVRPWEPDDRDLIDGGFESATVAAKIVPSSGPGRLEAELRIYLAILRAIPGDLCLASQDSAGPILLRVDSVVYIDPNGLRPEDVTGLGYHPRQLVTGIPPGLATADARPATALPVSAAS